MDAHAVIKAVECVTAKWTHQRKAEERRFHSAGSRRYALTPCRGVTIKDAAYEVIEDAYMLASDNGRYPAQQRQVMYASREHILERTGNKDLNAGTFFGVLLRYLDDYPAKTKDWDVIFDARGHFWECHTGRIVPLGTLGVREYLDDIANHKVPALFGPEMFATLRPYPTVGAKYRFQAVMFVEKEGWLPLFEEAQLGEKWDVAIMSTKGLPVVASRYLADQLCGPAKMPLFLLHDFDKAGLSMVGTFLEVEHLDKQGYPKPKRYERQYKYTIIDMGLRLWDAQEHKLQSEPVSYKSDPAKNLRENGATPEEIKFLRGWGRAGRRIELNSMTCPQLLAFIESKFRQHGLKPKLIPDNRTVARAWRRAVHLALAQPEIEALIERLGKTARRWKVPDNFASLVKRRLKADPAMPWDQAVAELAAEAAMRHEGQAG